MDIQTPTGDPFSLELFANMVYNNYVYGPYLSANKSPLTENHKANHARLLEQWKLGNPAKYEEAMKIFKRIQELAQNPEEIAKFEERRHRPTDGKVISVLETISLLAEEKQAEVIQQVEEVREQSQAIDFSQLEDADLIGTRQLDPLAMTLIRQKYGDRITVVEGKGEYFLSEHSERVESVVNDLGERVSFRPKGRLVYYDPVGVREYIPCFEITKQVGGQFVVHEIFSNIVLDELADPEYARAVAEFLLSDESLSFRNYGGYVGDVEKAALVQKNAIPIPPEPVASWNLPRPSKYCISYDAMALTAVKLYERQREKDKNKPIDGLGEFELDVSGR